MKKNPDSRPARQPGRPRGFDAGKALDAATQIFWARGYGDASLDDLTGAMGITRPSLYGAFGDKQTLYLQCIARYGAWVEAAVSGALADATRPRAALTRMFADAIALYTAPEPEPRGCLLAAASLPEAALSPVARKAVVKALGRLEAIVSDFFRRAGLTPKRAEEGSRLATTFLYGLSARARLGTAAETLRDDAGRFVDALI